MFVMKYMFISIAQTLEFVVFWSLIRYRCNVIDDFHLKLETTVIPAAIKMVRRLL